MDPQKNIIQKKLHKYFFSFKDWRVDWRAMRVDKVGKTKTGRESRDTWLTPTRLRQTRTPLNPKHFILSNILTLYSPLWLETCYILSWQKEYGFSSIYRNTLHQFCHNAAPYFHLITLSPIICCPIRNNY